MSDDMLIAALRAASKGWPVLPCHWPDKGQCSCGKGQECHSPAKHPIKELVPHGLKDATRDDSRIQAWWTRYPHANLGLVTGSQSGRVVIDVDGEDGQRSLAELEREHGALDTARVQTGSGGLHLYFTTDRHIRNKVRFRPGLDVRGDDGYVIGPRSRHICGGTYALTNRHRMVPLPTWLAALLREPVTLPVTPGKNGDGIPEGQRNAVLTSLAGTMRRRGMTEAAIEAALLEENRTQCQPPLTEGEVRTIAASVARYEPPNSSRQVTPFPDPPDPCVYNTGLAGLFARTIAPHTEADPVAILAQQLALFGNAIGRKPHWRVGATTHYLNLFLVLVGLTAASRKGTAYNEALRPLATADVEWSKRCTVKGLRTGEGLIALVRDRRESTEFTKGDDGVADKRLCVSESEFACVLKVVHGWDGNTLSPVIREAWESGHLATLTKNTPLRATDAHITIIGHITADEVRRELTRTEYANGFANRFLWFCARRSNCLPFGGDLPDSEQAWFAESYRGVLEFARSVGGMGFTPEAETIWREKYPTLSAGKPGLLGAVISRAEAQVRRLACLYALTDEESTVDARHLLAALALWRYCEASARYIFGDSLGDPDADAILEALRTAGAKGLRRTDVNDLFKGRRSTEALSRALSRLLELRLVRRVEERTEGRTAERWFLTELLTPAGAEKGE